MFNKRGVTINIVLALILILLSLLVIFVIIKRPENKKPEIDILEIENRVYKCIEDTAYEGLKLIGKRGSIYPSITIEHDGDKIGFLYYKGSRFLPGDAINYESEISQYIAENVDACIEDINLADLTIDKEISLNLKFDRNGLLIEAYYPIYIDEIRESLTDFRTYIETDFVIYLAIMNKIYDNTLQEPGWIDIDYLSNLPYEVQIIKIDSETIIYEVDTYDEFNYRFAIRFNR